ncbi:ribonuclease J [Candidatus Sneabacter namystus]|uniref:Ribonuclease J n=1 Tax=Candidatus Sneabacter namystus TaxID=2601646 RepID=A0A5C0UI66_9RICK|nr:ribonuclease J [Candidatus Sneabacter namystus]QEK39459.1 ribonuclease J [Candidatus Sneabacter namystus]
MQNLHKYNNALLFIPLGGTEEIGINLNVYHFRGKLLIVDCGSGFIHDVPGVRMVLPDISFLVQNEKKIVGAFITHSHEDHVGGLPYLLSTISCPLYATNFTANFIQAKLKEYSITAKINTIEPDTSFTLDPFHLTAISLTHSSPEMQALLIQTSQGNVLHTGDWKFDPGPLTGPQSNKKALKHYAKQGILALVCDSTNAFSEGRSGSEEKVQECLSDIIQKATGMILVTTFASNIARLEGLLMAAQQASKKVILLGKSMLKIFNIGKDSGYFLESEDTVINKKEASLFKRTELLILSTGCQGEKNAALSQIVQKNHEIKLKANDTVIFSSKIIPGNEKAIYDIMNHLVKEDVKVISAHEANVHTSGHPCQEELKEMYSIIKPQISVPVHGEPMHISKHAELAQSFSVPKIIKVHNGSVVLLDKNNPDIIGNVKTRYLAIDGNSVIPLSSPILKERRTLTDSGAIVITLLLNKDRKLIKTPILSTPGCLSDVTDKHLLESLLLNLSDIVKQCNSKQSVISSSTRYVTKFIKKELAKSPLVIVNVVTV